ncbi:MULTISPECIES: GNAT family N-acetyltransferase [Vibrio]|uniref:N-acetyltransferase domain-containing protein n=1 Tax=Vibrio proteolyticus NBRC 13287 TaxID=1219065 RepID=U3BNS7_VIBPR|nr:MULTISPECIES: GNAT family N-acetyltransferase [Vibrio]NAX21230.1 GNAT family N-acetyltransferase [Vibrio sp. V39_P1S14PM300]GAD68223.1 hypothetical protein VPR01S_12_00310 [Vibrio proteolyticus NBRC 13287]
MDIDFVQHPDEADYQTVRQGIIRYNRPHFSKQDVTPVACFARNELGEVKGGLTGEIYANTLFVEFLWVDDSLRSEGVGRQLMLRAEAEAKALGVTHLYLDTFTFQAREFYIKLGFEEVGRYTGYPTRGVDKIFLQKAIG